VVQDARTIRKKQRGFRVSQYKIALVTGSLRRGSFNRQLGKAVARLAPPEFSFHDIRIDDLPLYNQDDDSTPAATVQRLREEVRASDGIVFVTPEYNRSVPGVLKNAIDHASRPYGQSVWAGKPAGILGASVGAPGSSMAQQHLRNILAYLDVPTLGQPEVFLQVNEEFFDGEGNIANTGTRAFLQGWMDRYVSWVKKIAPR
jgi:chromate reductase